MIRVYGSTVIGIVLRGDVPYVVKTSESLKHHPYLVVVDLDSYGFTDKINRYVGDGGIEEFSSLLRYSL